MPVVVGRYAPEKDQDQGGSDLCVLLDDLEAL